MHDAWKRRLVTNDIQAILLFKVLQVQAVIVAAAAHLVLRKDSTILRSLDRRHAAYLLAQFVHKVARCASIWRSHEHHSSAAEHLRAWRPSRTHVDETLGHCRQPLAQMTTVGMRRYELFQRYGRIIKDSDDLVFLHWPRNTPLRQVDINRLPAERLDVRKRVHFAHGHAKIFRARL